MREYIRYEVTGVDRNGKRFKTIRCRSLSLARSYNIYRGIVWGITPAGNRKQLFQVYN